MIVTFASCSFRDTECNFYVLYMYCLWEVKASIALALAFALDGMLGADEHHMVIVFFLSVSALVCSSVRYCVQSQ